MSRAGYPVGCLSAYCGRIVCDGCKSRPVLLAWHKAQGTESEYLAGQERARKIVAREHPADGNA